MINTFDIENAKKAYHILNDMICLLLQILTVALLSHLLKCYGKNINCGKNEHQLIHYIGEITTDIK